MNGSYGLGEFLWYANQAVLGAALFFWSKPIARGVNSWSVRCYERFPRLKLLPGSQNAGTERNYKSTYICFRVCGALISLAAISDLLLLRK